MAQKVQVVLVDDIDGGSADETVAFALDGVTYEIDLSTKNATQAPRRVRPVGRLGPQGHRRRVAVAAVGVRRSGRSGDTAAVRAWARENGIAGQRARPHLGRRLAQYEAAH